MLNVPKSNVVNHLLPGVELGGGGSTNLICIGLVCGALIEHSGMLDHFG